MHKQEQRSGATRALWSLWSLCAAGALLTLAACDNRATNQTPGQQVDSAIAKTEDAAAAAARKAGELADKARDNTKAYIDSPAAKEDANAVKDALRNAGSALKSTVDDATITASVSSALGRDPELSARRIDVSTSGGIVSLSGPAPSAEAKARAATIAKSVTGVASVDNRLAVGVAN